MSKKLLSLSANFILGLLLLFYGLMSVASAAVAIIVLGVFAIVFGLAYILLGVFSFVKVSDAKFTRAFELSFYPLFVFVLTIIDMVLVGGNGLTPTDYIIQIACLAAALMISVFAFVALFVNNDIFEKILDISLVAFLGILLLELIFPVGQALATIGDISLFQLALHVSFGILAFDAVKGTLMKAKDSAEKQLEEKEEPKAEEKVEEEQPEEPQEEEKEEPKEEVQE